jgi:hypothetical protein
MFLEANRENKSNLEGVSTPDFDLLITISCFSYFETLEWSSGLSLNRKYQASAHTIPKSPSVKKVFLQPSESMTIAINGKANAAPNLPPEKFIPLTQLGPLLN